MSELTVNAPVCMYCGHEHCSRTCASCSKFDACTEYKPCSSEPTTNAAPPVFKIREPGASPPGWDHSLAPPPVWPIGG